jgi:4-hydroxybenzoate polyprenyltransferase
MISPQVSEERAAVDPATPSGALGRASRYLACVRWRDILVLQGAPLLGAVFAIPRPAIAHLQALAILAIADVLLVAHVFMLNDWSGVGVDLGDPNKAAGVFTTRGVARHEIAGLLAGLLVLSLLLFNRLGPTTFGLAVAIAALSALYSLPAFDWKARPLLNTGAHLIGGAVHFLLGCSIGTAIDGRSLATATFFGLTFAAGHLTQEVRDHAGDTRSAIRTNAVLLGPRRAFIASLGLFGLAHAVLLTLALRGTLPRPLAACGVLYLVQLAWSRETWRAGLGYADVTRLRTRYRVLYALIGVAMLATLWSGGLS